MKTKYNYSVLRLFPIMLFILSVKLSYSQSLITTSMIGDYEIINISDDLSNEVSDLFGNKKVKSKFFEIIGKTGAIKLNYSVLEAKLNTNTGIIEGGLNLNVIKVFTGYESSKKRNYIGFGGTYGVYDIRMELDFESGLIALTGSTVTSPENTKYRITIKNISNNKILLDYMGYTDIENVLKGVETEKINNYVTVSSSSSGGKNLIAYYPFNGNVNDKSGFGIYSSAKEDFLATDRFGKNNNAYFVNGSNSYFYIDGTVTNDMNAGTISFWLKTNSTQSNIQYNIFSKENVLRAQFGSADYFGNPLDTFYFIVNNEIKSESYVPINSDYNFTKWNHYVFTWDNTEKKIFFNGDLLYTSRGTFITSSTGDLYFGKNTENSKEILNGYLDEVRIYNYSISNSEVANLYEDEKP